MTRLFIGDGSKQRFSIHVETVPLFRPPPVTRKNYSAVEMRNKALRITYRPECGSYVSTMKMLGLLEGEKGLSQIFV